MPDTATTQAALQTMLEGVLEIARVAGAAILEVYDRADFSVETKQDESPLTAADLAAHAIIVEGLAKLAPGTPILSEESDETDFAERSSWQRYFLVDPLDGTKEFISRNGEFTVNIALVQDGVPILGVVYVPVQNVMYAGISPSDSPPTAFVERHGDHQLIRVRELAPRLAAAEPLVVVASRRHGSDAMAQCMDRLKQRFEHLTTSNLGSSLKLCMVAEGQADLYPRLAPTSEWDTAAAHGVVRAAGGEVVDTAFAPLRYNTKADLLNPYFYVLGDPSYPWRDCLAE